MLIYLKKVLPLQEISHIMRPLILISNDDGLRARGLAALIEAMRPLGDIFVCVPDGPRSGASCSITDTVPFRCWQVHSEPGLEIYACTATPCMCTKLAIDILVPRRPDLVVAGINHGSNASVNIHYSGTTAVSTEGALQGIPSIAFSLDDLDTEAPLDHLVPVCRQIASHALEHGIPFGIYLNVNFPAGEEVKGVRVCRMAYSRWVDEFEPCPRRRGGQWYWLCGEQKDEEPDSTDTDLWALRHHYAAVVPISIDPTDRGLINDLSNLNCQL